MIKKTLKKAILIIMKKKIIITELYVQVVDKNFIGKD